MATYELGNIVTGCVTGIEKYGIFVSLDEYYSGLIHISEISSAFVRNVNDFVKIGETINVKIVGMDEKTSHLKLSIKDIDYKIQKKNRVKIIETEMGFEPLKEQLNHWIDNKKIEIQEQSKKN